MNRVLKYDDSARGSEDRLRLALNSAGVGTWEWDLASGRLNWDDQMHRLFGVLPGAFSGRYHDFVALLHPADRAVLADQLARIGEGVEPEAREVEFRVALPDGGVRYLADRSEAVLDADGHVSRMIGVTWDISGRKEVEQELTEARNHAQAANARLKKDLAAAARIQRALLPAEEPRMPGLETAWLYRPCEELAGDGLNLFPVNDRYLVAYVFDVSGHGVSSSLLAVSVSRNLGFGEASVIFDRRGRGETERLISPAQVAERLNRMYPLDPRAGLYFTLVYGVLDLHTGEFRFVTAGNPGPVVVREGDLPRQFDVPAFPVGLFPEPSYQESSLYLNPGDRLYLFSDGLHEERDAQGEVLGWARIGTVLTETRELPLKQSLAALEKTAVQWHGSLDLSDDIALIGLEYRRPRL